jgi:heme/copper-type cytochrome/quinol oxidase subunit 3
MSDVTGTGRPGVTRSYDATSAVSVREVARRRRALPNGWWGMAMLVATEATLFGTLIATYFYLRFQVVHWPPPGIERPSVPLPLSLTGALLVTSLPVFFAVRATRAAHPGRAVALLALAASVQCGYLATQVVLYLDDLHRFSPKATAYGSIYFTLLLTHHVHVLVEILLGTWMAVRLSQGVTAYRLTGLRAFALYAYFVNTVAVVVVLTQLSPSL